MREIDLEILQQSYWEHFKKAKDLSHIYHPEHKERVLLQNEIDKILEQIKWYNQPHP